MKVGAETLEAFPSMLGSIVGAAVPEMVGSFPDIPVAYRISETRNLFDRCHPANI